MAASRIKPHAACAHSLTGALCLFGNY